MSSVGWRIVSASAVGTSHLKLGTPCQDSTDCRILQDTEGRPVLVVAVSDGAGSASKAEIGSWIACSTVTEAVEVYLADGGKVEDISIRAD